jgi:hypothetical protein
VTVPKSVCGPIRNWLGAGSPTSVSGGYRLMLNVQVGRWARRVRVSAGSPSAVAHSSSRSSVSVRMAAVQRPTSRASSGTSAGQTLGGNQTSSIAGSPVRVSAPAAKDSLRSGGVGSPSTQPFASTPGASHPRPPIRTA